METQACYLVVKFREGWSMRIIIKELLVSALLVAAMLPLGDRASAQNYDAQRRPVACTLEYLPVCATRHGRARTYSNACGAKAAGAKIVARAPC
jgi:hypothetical protein